MGTLFFPNPYSAHRSIMTEGTKCLVLLGPSATGKSTLAGRIIHQFGGIELNTMETLQARGIAKYDELYRMIACSNVDPHFYLPPRQRVRFVQASSKSPDAAILVVSPGCTTLGDVANEWEGSTRELFASTKVIVVVNKLDQYEWKEHEFRTAVRETQQELEKCGIRSQDLVFIPTSALLGTNMIELSDETRWYNSGLETESSNTKKGVTLLEGVKLIVSKSD